MNSRCFLLLPIWALLLVPSVAPAQPDSTASDPDSIKTYQSDRTILTEADEMTLREIISRCVEGEQTKLAGIRDMSYTAHAKSIAFWSTKKMIWNAVYMVYEEESGFEKSVELVMEEQTLRLEDGQWVVDEDDTDKEETFKVEAGSSDRGKDLARLPFFLKDQADYDFSLIERILEEDTVIFKIRFKPKSSFKPLPSGIVYVDATAFRIIHEEFSFEGENPFPLLLKDITRISRHWEQLATGEWVISKVLGEIDLRGFWKIPDRVQVAVLLKDYRFNQGYDEHRFGPRGDD